MQAAAAAAAAQQQQQQQQEPPAGEVPIARQRWLRVHQMQGKREASGQAGADSSGQAGSDAAAGEQPKRQRKGSTGTGGALGPLLEHRQALAGAVDSPAGPDDWEGGTHGADGLGDGATSGFRRSMLPAQEEEEEGAEEQARADQQPTSQQLGGPGGLPACAAAAAAADEAKNPEEVEHEQQEPNATEATRHAGGRTGTLHEQPPQHSDSSVWGSTLVCADLTVNDVASHYWPFLRSAMQGQVGMRVELGAVSQTSQLPAPGESRPSLLNLAILTCRPPAFVQTFQLHEDDEALVASLVAALGDTIAQSYARHAGPGSGSSAALSGHVSVGDKPSPDLKSLVAATAFDDLFRDRLMAESSGASGS